MGLGLMGIGTYLRFLESFTWKNPPYLIFFATSKCNSKCRHCFYWRQIAESAGKRELSLKEIEEIAGKYGKLMYLSIGGGEPLLRNDIPEICLAFHRHTGVSLITITTNGLLPRRISKGVEKALIKCPEVQFTVPLSIDGILERQDSIRGVKGCFGKVMQTYKELAGLQEKYANLAIDVGTVVASYNQDRIEEVLEFVEKNMPAVRNHGIGFARGPTKEEKAKDVSAERLRQITAFAAKAKERNRRQKSFSGRLFDALSLAENDIALRFAEGKCGGWNCFAGQKFVEINEVGEVFPCEMLFEKIGSLRESGYDTGKILKSEKAKAAIAKIKSKRCNCTFECAIANSIVYSPGKYPGILSKMGKI
ncbi:MAG: radical SAM protein [Candidatus Diapherotrites archaeon]